MDELSLNADDQSYIPVSEYQSRPQTSQNISGGRKSLINLKPKSIAGRSHVSKASSIRSKLVEFKKQKLIEAITKLDEPDVDQLSRQLKIDTNPRSVMNSVLTQENLERLKDSTSQPDKTDLRPLTEKLNSIKAKDE